jgi:hypothetical protein
MPRAALAALDNTRLNATGASEPERFIEPVPHMPNEFADSARNVAGDATMAKRSNSCSFEWFDKTRLSSVRRAVRIIQSPYRSVNGVAAGKTFFAALSLVAQRAESNPDISSMTAAIERLCLCSALVEPLGAIESEIDPHARTQ